MKQKEHLNRGKRGVLSVIFGRTGILLMLILLQIGLLLVGFRFLSNYIFAIYGGSIFLGFVLSVYLINRKGNPAFKIAWMVPILTVPVFGALFYLYFHLQLESHLLNQKVVKEVARTASLSEQKEEDRASLEAESPQMANMISYLRKVSNSAVHTNTTARYYPSGESAFDVILQELSAAKHYIFIEFFIVDQGYMWETILEILRAKVREGVEVRIMYDGMSDYFRLPVHYARHLNEEGIKCQVFSPIVPLLSTVQNNRDHRKIMVVDGHTAFTGGINLADEYINQKERFGYWKDACLMLKGDAVRDFTLMFLQMWNVVEYVKLSKTEREKVDDHLLEEYRRYIQMPIPKCSEEGKGFVIPYDDNPLDDEQVGELVYLDILNTAKKYVHIMTPYLVLDHNMIVALTYAAKRGVDVKIIMPHIPDKKYAFILARTFYNELLDAGVEIYEFLPGFVHSKVFVSDDEKAVVGSINMDFRSLYLSFECAALLYKNKEISTIEADFQESLKSCEKVTKEVYNSQPAWKKLAGSLLRLFAPLM
ncbi:cardiolipin synthase [Jingyaoa shaoxingensis]|uniref:Cardiolipin synthase n=1 Tax=Jingyaoa shaoxingensis TaxID=2763671 RepID=A0ABR7NCM9_9FIRM|nr:cardiolipin synthase [Jingyaoa shaoxingensis]MBC8574146.1 cardiolipin synthase [Jingyaoa shaoxingensis]